MDRPRTHAAELLDEIERDADLANDAALSRASGVPQTQISKWRNGGQAPRESSMRALIESVGLDPQRYGFAPRAKLYPVGEERQPGWAIRLEGKIDQLIAIQKDASPR